MAPLDSQMFSIKRPHLGRYKRAASHGLIVETYNSDAGVMWSQGALHRISINRTAHGRYACRYEGGAFRTVERPAFTLGLQPAGKLLEVDGDGADYISIFQHPRVFRDAGWTGGVGDPWDEQRLSARADAMTLHLALALAAAAQAGDAADPLTTEHLGIGLARCVVRLLGLRPDPEREMVPLDARRLRRVLDRIESELARQDLTVAVLAEAAHMSVSRFSRAFKQALGVAPHQFILSRRVERACHLLVDGSAPLSLVAYATGFSSQAHFSTVFRKRTGTTPKQFRQSRLA